MKAKTLYLTIGGLLAIIIAVLVGACRPPTRTPEGVNITPPPESCKDKVAVEYRCWTSKFPGSWWRHHNNRR